MPGSEKFVEQVKRERLYDEYQQGGDVSAMLEQSPTNSRVNEAMARWCMIGSQVSKNWRGKYKNLFGSMFDDIQRHFLNMEGYARVQAIDMCAAHTITEKALLEKKEKGGLLGIFNR